MSRRCDRTDLDLTAFALGELAGEALREAETHLASCPDCRRESEEIAALLGDARALPRLDVSGSFHDRLLSALRDETADPAPERTVILSLREKLALNAGYVGLRLRQSVFAKALLAAAIVNVLTLFTLGYVTSGSAPEEPELYSAGTEESEGRDPAKVRSSTVGSAEDWYNLLPEEAPRGPLDLAIDKLDPPRGTVPSPEAKFPLTEEIFEDDPASPRGRNTPIPDRHLAALIDKENTVGLGQYRMFARSNQLCKAHVMEGRGGDEKTVYAVDRGLKWLRYHQEADGSWDPEAWSGDTALEFGGDPRARVGLTALSVAAFLSDGHTENTGRYADTVSNGVNFILASRDVLGRFGAVEGDPGTTLFNQSVAVLALSENYLLTGGKNEDALRLGVGRLVKMVEDTPEGLAHGAFSDTWAAMALRTVQLAGLGGGTVAAVSRRVEDRVALLARNEIVDLEGLGLRPPLYTASIEAVGALFPGDDPDGAGGTAVPDGGDVAEGAGGIPALDPDTLPLPDWRKPETMFNLLEDPDYREPSFLFFIGTALCENGRPTWPEWNRRVKTILLDEQDRKGHWKVEGDWPWIDGGDIYTTSLSILTLQVYYRFIKIEENCP